MKRRIFPQVAALGVALVTGALLLSAPAQAQVLNPALEGSVKAKKIYRGSLITYENVFALRDLDKGAETSYVPYYAQSISFSPQIWLRDDMFISGNLAVEVEMTTSQSTDTVREPMLSDLFLTYMWLSAYTIPVLKIGISPTVRLRLPTSKLSQAMTMMASIEPGVLLSRSFKLHSGKWFSSIALMYGFRFGLRLHEYQQMQVDVQCSAGGGAIDTVGGINPVACATTGDPNSKYRFMNSFIVRANMHPKIFLTLSVVMINDLTYELSAYDKTHADGTVQHIPASGVNHSALISSSFVVTVPVLDWLYISAGLTSFHTQLKPDSTYEFPLFNRATNFFFDMTIPIDKVVDKVSGWAS